MTPATQETVSIAFSRRFIIRSDPMEDGAADERQLRRGLAKRSFADFFSIFFDGFRSGRTCSGDKFFPHLFADNDQLLLQLGAWFSDLDFVVP